MEKRAFFYTLILFVVAIILYLSRRQVAFLAPVILGCIGSLFVFGGLLLAIYFSLKVWKQYEEVMNVKEQRKTLVITAPEGHQAFLRDTDHNATVRPLHLMPGYTNSKPMHSTEDEQRWLTYQATRRPKVIEAASKLLPDATQLPTSGLQTFYNVLDHTDHLMLIGGTHSGKSYQMSFAVRYLLNKMPNSKAVWLSTHAQRDANIIPVKWYNDPDDIICKLNEIHSLFLDRRKSAMPQTELRTLIIVLDEWRSFIRSSNEMGLVLADLATEGRKFGIILILASQSSRVEALGLKGRGDVKESFAEVILRKDLTQQQKAILQQGREQIEIELPKRRELAKLIADDTSKNQAAIAVYGRNYGGNLVGKF